MNNNFDNLSNSQMTIRRKHINFDLEAFVKEHSMSSDAAVIMVTPSQCIMTDCFVRDYYGNVTHENTLRAIYTSIYEDAYNYGNTFEMMVQFLKSEHIIFILLCRSFSCISILGIPDVISSCQYDFLVKFNDMIKNMYLNNDTTFEYMPMHFSSFSGSFVGSVNVNNFDLLLDGIDQRIGNVENRDEIILGDSIKTFELNDVNNKVLKKYLKK